MTDHPIENVVIISLDCVRREALGCYPQRFPWRSRILQEAKTPNIDRLCADGHRFDQAVTHAPFTPVAHASLFTGLLPPRHRLRTFLGSELSEDVVTLAEVLSANGWQCGAVVGSHALSKEYGLPRGFHYYDDDIRTGIRRWHKGERRGASEVTDRALSWLSSIGHRQRFLLFVHYFDAHNLTSPSANVISDDHDSSSSASLRGMLRDLLPDTARRAIQPIDRRARSLYGATLRAVDAGVDRALSCFEAGRGFSGQGRRYMLAQTSRVDAQIGILLETLQDQGRLDSTLIILLADHGDSFWEHGEATHRQFLYDTTLVVPLVLHPRLGDRTVIDEQVSLVDVFPTVLSIVGVEFAGDIDGQSLIGLLPASCQPERSATPRTAYSETVFESLDANARRAGIETCHASLRRFPWKLIWDRLAGTHELYRVDVDPHEKSNLVGANPDLVATMSAELYRLAGDIPVSVPRADGIVEGRLIGLGYL